MTNDRAAEIMKAIIFLLDTDAYSDEVETAIHMAINALTAQPETHEKRTETHACDCISRQAAIDALDCINGVEEVLRALPSAQPQRTGRWRHYEGWLTCSKCGAEYYDDIIEYCGDNVPRFCPDCGASMTEKAEENDGTNER